MHATLVVLSAFPPVYPGAHLRHPVAEPERKQVAHLAWQLPQVPPDVYARAAGNLPATQVTHLVGPAPTHVAQVASHTPSHADPGATAATTV